MEIKILGQNLELGPHVKITEDCIKDHAVGMMIRNFLLNPDRSLLNQNESRLLEQFGRQVVEYFHQPRMP